MMRRRLVVAAVYVLLVLAGLAASHWLSEIALLDVRPSNEPRLHAMIMSITAIFIFAAALPFVPAAEIGLGLILLLGSRIAMLVYVGMVGALMISYAVGRLIPASAIARGFDFVGLGRARDLVLRSAPLDAEQRLALFSASAPSRLIPFLLRHRYIALAVAINLPGNTLLGGGGGLALSAGMSGLFPAPRYFLTVAIAVSPLPVAILLTGLGW